MSIAQYAKPRTRRTSNDELLDPSPMLTPEGSKRLQNEMEHLRYIRLPLVVEWMQDVASDGYDDDGGEYERARSEFEYLQQRIRKIDKQLASAKVLVDPVDSQVVRLGSRVTVTDGETVATYRIVGRDEANPSLGFISDRSPVGRAVLGRLKGELIVVETPDGPIQIRVLEIA